MSIIAAIEEIEISTIPAPVRADRAALARLDRLVAQLEDMNLRGVDVVPPLVHLEIGAALEGLISVDVNVPSTPAKALDLVFAGQARILRGLYPEFEDEFDDE